MPYEFTDPDLEQIWLKLCEILTTLEKIEHAVGGEQV